MSKLSEYDGPPQRNTLPPPQTPIKEAGHTQLKAYEQLRLEYRSGVDAPSTSDYRPDAFDGLLPLTSKPTKQKVPR